jgi:hypothetical protein
MLETQHSARTTYAPSTNWRNIDTKKNISKGVQRKSTPYMFRYNPFGIKGSLKPKGYNIDTPLNFQLNKDLYLKCILKYFKKGYDFNIKDVNEKNISKVVKQLQKDRYFFKQNNDEYYILKEYDKKTIGGYGCELIYIYKLKENYTKEYELLIGCLSLLKDSKIMIFNDHYSYECHVEMIKDADSEIFSEEDDHEEYSFDEQNEFIHDLENSKVSINLIRDLIKKNKYPHLNNIFKLTDKMLKTDGSIFDSIYCFEEDANPIPFLLFYWDFGDRMGEWLNMDVNQEYGDYNENWLNCEYGQKNKQIDLHFKLLEEFYSIDEKIINRKSDN